MPIRMVENILVAPIAATEIGQVSANTADFAVDEGAETPESDLPLPGSIIRIDNIARDLVSTEAPTRSAVEVTHIVPSINFEDAPEPTPDSTLGEVVSPSIGIPALDIPESLDPSQPPVVAIAKSPNSTPQETPKSFVSDNPVPTAVPSRDTSAMIRQLTPENAASDEVKWTTPEIKPDQSPKNKIEATVLAEKAAPMSAIKPEAPPTTLPVNLARSDAVSLPSIEAAPVASQEAVGGLTVERPSVYRLDSAPNPTPTVATRPQPQPIASQIVAAVTTSPNETIELRLDPPELGRVHVTISTADGGVSALITTEKPEIADLLRRHSEILSREFAKSGFEGAALKFSQHDQNSGHGSQEQQIFEQFTTQSESEATPVSANQPVHLHHGGLDIRL